MDRKLTATTSWVLVGGTMLLGGCMTPGFHNQEPPGFSTTFQEYDRYWQPVDGITPTRIVLPAQFELETGNLPTISSPATVQHEELLLPARPH